VQCSAERASRIARGSPFSACLGGWFGRGITEFRPLSFRREIIRSVQFMPTNDCNLRPIQLTKPSIPPPPPLSLSLSHCLFHSPAFSTFGPSLGPPAPPSPFPAPAAPAAVPLACRKVQNSRRKRAIRDQTPLTFHFSWSKIIPPPPRGLCTVAPARSSA